MSEIIQLSESYREFDLVKARQFPSKLQPASHQNTALEALRTWFEAKRRAPHGGIVVLPTGGGKIAKTILRVANEHNFAANRTEVFF